MAQKKALITGITGQDGSYLAELLLEKGYEVHGIKRRASSFNTERIDHLYQDPHEADPRFILHYGDMTDSSNLNRIIEKVEPVVETVLDNSLKPGEKVLHQAGRIGYKTKTYKSIIKNGKVVKKELLHSDYYKPRKYIYKIGPKVEEQVETSTEEVGE